MSHMKWHILKVSFWHAFNRKRGNNILALMFDLKFKNMQLVIAFLGYENVVIVDYD